MAETKRRRTRTRHPGVKLVRRARKNGSVWLARWTDPDTGKTCEVSLTALELTTQEARRAWAIEKSDALAERKRKIATGAAQKVRRWKVQEAINDYLARAGERLGARTVVGYRDSLTRFSQWAEKAGVRHVNDLTTAHLAMAKDWLARGRKRVVVREGKRGERKTSTVPYSANSVNARLRDIRVWLHECRRFGRTPHLDREGISEALSSVRGHRSRPVFLRPSELVELLEAALRHDADCYTLTRAEKDGKGDAGTTPKNEPIAPFVAFVLLSGCRLGEARALRWSWCSLKGAEPEVVLPAAAVKTRHERSVDLKITPSLVKLLGALRLRSGGRPFVFGGDGELSQDATKAAHRRLIGTYGAPEFTWQRLRQSCATYLANAPGVYGAASVFLEAKRLGHSVTVSEQRYSGIYREIPKTADTLEKAMRIEDVMQRIVVACAAGNTKASLEESETALVADKVGT